MNSILLPAGPQPDQTLLLLGSVFAALLGLAFGSFLNVCLSRLPERESIAVPRSHCRSCTHVLAWWENLPVLSWLLLRGRCRQCHQLIGLRYPLVELAVGLLWCALWAKSGAQIFQSSARGESIYLPFASFAGYCLFGWMLIGLAALDAEYLWLPDWVTLPGIGIGFALSLLRFRPGPNPAEPQTLLQWAYWSALGILAAASLILVIRLAYWTVRRREGIGLGDAKLMAMLGAWLGLRGALESFALAILGAAATAIIWIVIQKLRRNQQDWMSMPLPLGTFLCLAAITEVLANGWFWNWWSATFGLNL